MSNRTKSRFFVIVQLICSVAIMLTGQLIVTGLVNWILVIGSGLLVVWAFILNKPRPGLIFPEPPPDMKLITTGPYRFIRHPMYTALLMITIAWVLNDFSWLRLLVWTVLVVNMLFKLSYEEGLLAARCPGYTTYKTKTKRLIPFVLTFI